MTAAVELRNVTVAYPAETALAARLRGRAPRATIALDDVNLAVESGESLAIAGESGCGKSTLARALAGLVAPTVGDVIVDGRSVGIRRDKAMRRRIQMVFQDPASSLNPSRTVAQTLTEVLRVHRLVPKDRIGHRCAELLDLVQLPASTLGVRPRALSGGQRQRVGIARALALQPDVLVADEAVAALDVSVQASILNILADLRAELGLAIVFISHDLTVLRHLSERLAVMYLGRIVETGPTSTVFSDPRHPYTRALLAAAPDLTRRHTPGDAAITGEPPNLLTPPAGCPFHPRCPDATDVCGRDRPTLAGPDAHRSACHYSWT